MTFPARFLGIRKRHPLGQLTAMGMGGLVNSDQQNERQEKLS
jgi:hypothetical protein